MRTILKYTLTIEQLQVIQMPFGSKILCVQTQDDEPRIWVECEKDNTPVPRKFLTILTGNEIHEEFPEYEMQYIGTVQTDNGMFVMHIFELLNH